MKKILFAALALLAASCNNPETDTQSLETSPTTLDFEATGSTPQTVQVKAQNVAWEHAVSADAKAWMTVTQDGNTLSVSVSDNYMGEKRIGQIRIRPTDGSKLPARSVTVTQQANPAPPELSLSVNPASLTFQGEGAAPQQVTVTASAELLSWTAAPDQESASWITATTAGDRITVTVADNPDTRLRAGNILVIPSEEAAAPKTLLVIQEGKILPPALTVTPAGPIELPYNGLNGNLYLLLNVEAQNTEWIAKAVDAEDKALDWASTTVSTSEGYINLSFARNTQKQPRSGFVVVTPSAEELEEIRIPLTQTAAPDHLSTLAGDLDIASLGLDHGYSALMPYAPYDTLLPTIQWELNLLSEGLTVNPDFGTFEGSGHRLHFLPVTDRMEANDDNLYPLADGVYDVVATKPFPENPEEIYHKDAWTIDKGTEGTSWSTKYSNFWYLEYRDNEIVGSAPIISGTVTVTKTAGFENTYSIEFDLLDDFGNRITGTYAGSIGLNVNGTRLPD